MSSYIAYLEQVQEHIKVNFPLHLESFVVFLNIEKECYQHKIEEIKAEHKEEIKESIKVEHKEEIKAEHIEEHKVLRPLKKLKLVSKTEPSHNETHSVEKEQPLPLPQNKLKLGKLKPVVKSLTLEQPLNQPVVIVP